MIIKTAIIVDVMGHGLGEYTPEMEVAHHLKVYRQLLAPAELKATSIHHVCGIEPGTDLVVYDYGGLMPGNNLMSSNAHEIVQWAKDNPSSLVSVVSGFTYSNFIRSELKELGLQLCNVILDNGRNEDPIPEWFRDYFKLPPCNLDDVLDAKLAFEMKDLISEFEYFGFEYTPEPEIIIPEEIPEIQKTEPVEINDEPADNEDWTKEAPKEPVAWITVPVYCDWYPGVHRGHCRFKIANSMVDITEGEGNEEKQIAHMGGAFGGVYEISFLKR